MKRKKSICLVLAASLFINIFCVFCIVIQIIFCGISLSVLAANIFSRTIPVCIRLRITNI